MARAARILAPLALAASACGTLVAPETIRAEDALSAEQKDEHLGRWERAVHAANEFLASEHNESLPPGRYELRDHGMIFVTEDRVYELTVRNTWWGDLCVATGFTAQERSWGFVVGDRGEGPQVTANSFFRFDGGRPKDPQRIAELILHETAHQVHGVGTLGPWSSLRYYWLALFHRHGSHPDERLPLRTSREFLIWAHPGMRAVIESRSSARQS